MPQQNYLDELTPAFTPLLAIKEASRCLLCHDAPCSQACPAQTDPGKFIRSIYFRNFKGAAETIRENNALGAVCARVCPTEKLCQSGCTRAGVDAPIDIGRLQRFVTDFEQQTGMEIYQPGTKTLGKVAIIGAGPAGLQASVTLTNQGYDVTIYEKEAQPGGWLRNGIPQFRLPQSVLDAEIARIEKMGVTIKCNNEIGKTLTLEQLKAEIAEQLAPYAGREIITFHEAFTYFAEAFGLHVAGVIATEPGEEPSTRDIADTCDLVNTLGIRTLFVEPQYPQKAAQTIARETGAGIYTLDPCVSGDGSMESYENIMRENARVLTEAFAQ